MQIYVFLEGIDFNSYRGPYDHNHQYIQKQRDFGLSCKASVFRGLPAEPLLLRDPTGTCRSELIIVAIQSAVLGLVVDLTAVTTQSAVVGFIVDLTIVLL